MQKIKFFITIGIIILLIYITYTPQTIQKVCVREKCFDVSIADTPDLRAKGFMDTPTLSEHEGKLFIFEKEGTYGFWMKNTTIPLDIIWISKDRKILAIVSAEPCLSENCIVYKPYVSSKYVLEILSGQTNNFTIGETVLFLD